MAATPGWKKCVRRPLSRTLNASTLIVAPPGSACSLDRSTPCASHSPNRNRPRSSSPTTPIASTGKSGSRRFTSIAMLKPEPPPCRTTSRTSLAVSSLGQRAIDLLKSTQKVPADSTPRRALIKPSVLLQRRLGDFAVVDEIPHGRHALLAQRLVVVLDCLERGQRAVGHRAHQPHDVERRLGEVDLAPEQGDARAVLLRLMDELEAVARRARPAAEHADHKARIEGGELLERPRPIICDFQKSRPLDLGEAREAPDNRVVDEVRDEFGVEGLLDVRVEHLEKV